MVIDSEFDYLAMAENAWERTRTLLTENTRLSFIMDSDIGWRPIMSHLKNNLYYLAKVYPEFNEWSDWIIKEYGRDDLEWSYFRLNDRYIALKYELEELVKKRRKRDGKDPVSKNNLIKGAGHTDSDIGLPFKIMRNINVGELLAIIEGPDKAPNPDYKMKRWYHFWIHEGPEYFQKDDEYISQLSRLIQSYHKDGGTIHECSTFDDGQMLEGESGYVLLREGEVIVQVVKLQS